MLLTHHQLYTDKSQPVYDTQSVIDDKSDRYLWRVFIRFGLLQIMKVGLSDLDNAYTVLKST